MNYLHSDFDNEGQTCAEYRHAHPSPRHRFPTAALWAIGAALAIIAAVLLASVSIAQATPTARAVALSDAAVPPTYLVYLWPHGSVTFARETGRHRRAADNCPRGGYFSDVSAYAWNGAPLAPQRWDRIGVYYWQLGHGHHGRVTFDGITFRNESSRKVLVAGWCER